MSEIHDLRSYISVLEDADQLVRIQKPVDIEYELANVAAALERSGGAAPFFENPQSPAADTFPWPIFSSAVANKERAAIALRCNREEIIEVIEKVQDPEFGIPSCRGSEAIWKENVITGADVDLTKLPIPTHTIHDGGPFITSGVMMAHDPETGRGNLSFNRLHIKGPNRTGCHTGIWHHLGVFHKAAEDRGEPLECAIAIGLDPAIMIAAGCRTERDELEIAGAIMGKGVPVVKGVTVNVDIPADAEIVIEGRLLAEEREEEGPLAEFHGFYGEAWASPVFEVTAICYRDNPIYQTIIPGWFEHINLGNTFVREPLLLRHVRHVSKNVTRVHIPAYTNGFTVIVQMDKDNPGEPRNVAMAALAAHVNFRICIVVDPDVDIYDSADVLWALTSRVDWGDDNIFFVHGALNHEMDPVANKRGVGTKVGIDATYKKDRAPKEYSQRVHYQPVDLEDYLGIG